MGKFSYKDILQNKLSMGKAAGYEEIYLDPRNVEPSESNFYSVENIEELADSILTVGQQQPTVLGKVNGVYKIASGHRRNLANILNINRGHEEFHEVKFLFKEMTEAEFELNLIIGNAFNRKLTPYEEAEQVRKLKDALERAKREDGLEIQGRLRDVIAELLNKKPTQVTELNKISTDLSDTAKEKFKKGEIGKTTAYELSKLPHEDQDEIVGAAEENNLIKGKEIAEMIREKQEEKQAEKLINTSCESESDTKKQSDFFEPTPEYIDSLCYGCENWDKCTEKLSTVTNCNEYKQRNQKSEQTAVENMGVNNNRVEIPQNNSNVKEVEIQHGLQILKNDSQRKEWIDNYQVWPLWIEIEQTSERFYRYDFENGTSFVVKVSLYHPWERGKYSVQAKYGCEEYYILGVKDADYHKGTEKTFFESKANKSAMVEYLKEIQKK